MDQKPPPASLSMRSLRERQRERQREERAALILEAAQQVFNDKGYYDASIDEIAARAGIAKGTVYLHFSSKEDLVVALFVQQFTEFLAQIEQTIRAALPVRVRLEHLLLDVYMRIHAHRNQVLLDLNPRLGLTTSVIEKRPELAAYSAQALERMTVLLEEGKLTGELDQTVPTPVMVATLVNLLSPSGYEHLLTSGAVAPADLAAYISRTFFPGPVASASPDA